MRLIDLDKVSISVHASKEVAEEVGRQLINAPIVKAIPIEWIEKYIWGADTHEEKRALRKMYIQWEKENDSK